jgi:hypothetical protein
MSNNKKKNSHIYEGPHWTKLFNSKFGFWLEKFGFVFANLDFVFGNHMFGLQMYEDSSCKFRFRTYVL